MVLLSRLHILNMYFKYRFPSFQIMWLLLEFEIKLGLIENKSKIILINRNDSICYFSSSMKELQFFKAECYYI